MPDGVIRFSDRIEAGRLLAAALEEHRTPDLLVLGIPRGGVPVAAEVARALNAELDIIVACKLGAPGQPELAIGAVTENGGQWINEAYVRDLEVSEVYLRDEIDRKMAEAHERKRHMRGDKPAPRIEGRTVIVVDDGLATGATMRAALRSVRSANPARLVMAAPVGSREACEEMRTEADEVVCLVQPQPFYAVGLYFQDFEPTEEDEVRALLQQSNAPASG